MSQSSPSSVLETLLEVQPLAEAEADVFVYQDRLNQGQLLKGQGDRLFGGVTLGQSLSAAQQTVGLEFVAHSMHCTFVSASLPASTIEYHVERVKDGRRFCVRSVRAVQGRRTIFLGLINFTLESLVGNLQYALRFPRGVPMPPAKYDDDSSRTKQTMPFLHHSVGIRPSPSSVDEPARIHQWVRAREPVSAKGGRDAHLAVLACLSDSYLLAVAPHTHGIWDFVSPPSSEVYDGRHRLELPSATSHRPIPRPHLQYPSNGPSGGTRLVTSMASLDHCLYFHDPARLRADQWLLAEVHSTWAGGGRVLVHQTIWGADGTLVASCTQEGLVSVEDLPKRGARL